MPLSPRTRLGPYEILAPLGAGGMGEVYRARDTRLGREVAIKVLPQHVASTPEDRARFAREAKIISALNHPHVCTLHDVGREGDTDYLVMELVEGETLSRRIARGSLSTPEVLRIGSQIADALDRAHNAGIVHRDLKPSNVMLTKSGAKLMDFGLAHGTSRLRGSPADATETAPYGYVEATEEPITAKGTALGTYPYMSPEQLEGKAVDARSDIWALGCVLYEMATGRRAFDGPTAASVISRILRDEPQSIADLAPMTPAELDRSVRQCIAKDPLDRWQTVADLRRELLWIAEPRTRPGGTRAITGRRPRHRLFLGGIVAIGLIGLAIVGAVLQLRRPEKPIMFELQPPANASLSTDWTQNPYGHPRISPDGRTLAFNATDSAGVSTIWVRQVNSLQTRRLPRTEGAGRPFWSPDSKFLAYFVGRRLMKLSLTDEGATELCEAPDPGDGTWGRSGFILFDGTADWGIRVVPESGGAPVEVTPKNSGWPVFLPDGHHFLYVATHEDGAEGDLRVGSIDREPGRTLGTAYSRVEYANGQLLCVRDGALVAQQLDPQGRKLRGEPKVLARDLEVDKLGFSPFSTSSEGTLVYYSGASHADRYLVWIDRQGKAIGTVGPPNAYDQPAISPDGAQLAVAVGSNKQQSRVRVWLWDLIRNTGRPVSVPGEDALSPVWAPDGSRILYDGWPYRLIVQSVDRDTIGSVVYTAGRGSIDAGTWSSDGRWILFMSAPDNSNIDIVSIPASGGKTPQGIVTSPAWDIHPALTRDGMWLAYASFESGRYEVYVRQFPAHTAPWRISTLGGVQPSWRGDDRELFYLALDGSLMSVTVYPGTPPRFSIPRALFKAPSPTRLNTRNQYAVTRDGQKFLFAATKGKDAAGTTKVVLHWPALLTHD